MKLARFWTRQAAEAVDSEGQTFRAVARGWSNESVEAAADAGRIIAGRIAAKIASGQMDRGAYLYGDRPLPEPILREFQNGSGGPRAVITRNLYGALVLNARELMFVDIDRETKPAVTSGASKLVSGFLGLFGKPAAGPPQPPPTDPILADIQSVSERNRVAVRVYKTAAGYRALITSGAFQPGGGLSETLLQQYGSDPLYIRLCKMQESFRARLTPKPWRCGLAPPPVTFPFESPADESQFRSWDAKYQSKIAGYATCRYLTSFGGTRIEPAFDDLVRYHDLETKASTNLPLA